MKFSDLSFVPHPVFPDTGVQAKEFFPNGYGVSVVQFPGSYGAENGLYELAVLTSDGKLTYATPITEDVEGHLTEDAVMALVLRVRALPNA